MASTAQKAVAGLVLMGILATILLPDRQTVPVLGAFTNLGVGLTKTAQGR